MSRSGGTAYAWIDESDEARWALAIAWCWAHQAGLLPDLDQHNRRCASLTASYDEDPRCDCGLEELLAATDAEPDTARSPALEHARAWRMIAVWPITPDGTRYPTRSDWRRLAGACGPGVRGIARALLADADPDAGHYPSWWGPGSVRSAGSLAAPTWEVCLGYGTTLVQCGEWEREADARCVLAALRPTS